MKLTLDEWVNKNCAQLSNDIKNHLTIYVENCKDVAGLYRCIMTSIRQNGTELKLNDKEKQ